MTSNATEGTVYTPNCNANDATNNWAYNDTRKLTRFFGLTNEPYGNGLIYGGNPPDSQLAKRGQMAQMLMLAQGYTYNPLGTDFGDSTNHFARLWIRMAAGRNVINGYNDLPHCGSYSNIPCFLPESTAIRGQFAKMIVRARQYTIINPPASNFDGPCGSIGYNSFRDVCKDNTFYPEIETARSENLILGYNDGTFRWNADVTRPQMIAIVARSLPEPALGCW